MKLTIKKTRRGFTTMITRQESAHVEAFTVALTLALTTHPLFFVIASGRVDVNHKWDMVSVFADRFGLRAVYDYSRDQIANWHHDRGRKGPSPSMLARAR